MKTMFKKVLKIALIVVVTLFAVALAVPYVFKSQIVTLIKNEINKKLTATVNFKDVDISFFRHFPKVSIGLDELQVIGTGQFLTDTLISAKKIDAAVNFMSLVKGSDFKIYSINIESPRIHAIVLKDSATNWNILKPDTVIAKVTEKKPFTLALQNYSVTKAYVKYKDAVAGIETEITNLNHEGSGDFTSEIFTLKTNTTAEALTVIYNSIAFLSNAKVSVDAALAIDNKTGTYTYNTNKILLNALAVSSKGSIKTVGTTGYDMDIKFDAPAIEFKNLLSLVPAIYKNDFDKIKTTGTAMFSGFVKGLYNKNSIPAYHVNMEVKEGYFQYPDLPKPLQHINIKALVDNPDGQTDNAVIQVDKASFVMENDPFEMRLLIKKPVSNMYVDAAAKGKLDLAKVGKLTKLQAGTTLSGLLNADMFVKGNVKAIQQQNINGFTAGGTIDLNNFVYIAKDYPSGVKINTLRTVFNPAKVVISTLNGQYLATNFSAAGEINNLLNYLLQNKPLSANFNLKADNIDLNKWMGTSADSAAKGPGSKPFAVPENLNISLTTIIDKLHYDKVDITNLSGGLKVADQTVSMNNVKGNALDGMVMINGTYSTKDNKIKPAISLTYNVDKVDVQKTFAAFNTVQKIMPIGKFIAGKLSSQLSLKGSLGDNMMPDMQSLTGNGNLLLIEGFLSKFAPLEKIASTLNVTSLNNIALKDVRNYFEFSNGKVLVKPFTVKTNGIDMEIGGLQGFDQSIDYVINMKLPRALMGAQGNQLVNNLVSQINNKGVPIKIGETINLKLNVGGFFNKPTIKTDLKQGAGNLAEDLKQQATAFAKAKIDSIKQAVTSAVKDTIASVKKQVIASAKEELLKQISGNKNSVADSTNPKPKPQEAVKGLINNLFKKKVKDTAK